VFLVIDIIIIRIRYIERHNRAIKWPVVCIKTLTRLQRNYGIIRIYLGNYNRNISCIVAIATGLLARLRELRMQLDTEYRKLHDTL